MRVLTVTSDADWDDQADQVAGSAFMLADGQPWVVFCSEQGDWYALRPVHEDDGPQRAGSSVIEVLDSIVIPFPWRITTDTNLEA